MAGPTCNTTTDEWLTLSEEFKHNTLALNQADIVTLPCEKGAQIIFCMRSFIDNVRDTKLKDLI